MNTIEIRDLMDRLSKIKGGYEYSGACSLQVCFPLKAGGELRFALFDDDGPLQPGEIMTDLGVFGIDLYDGSLPPGISGPAKLTGPQ